MSEKVAAPTLWGAINQFETSLEWAFDARLWDVESDPAYNELRRKQGVNTLRFLIPLVRCNLIQLWDAVFAVAKSPPDREHHERLLPLHLHLRELAEEGFRMIVQQSNPTLEIRDSEILADPLPSAERNNWLERWSKAKREIGYWEGLAAEPRLDVADIVERFDVTQTTVTRAAAGGKLLGAYKSAGEWRIHESSASKLWKSRESTRTKKPALSATADWECVGCGHEVKSKTMPTKCSQCTGHTFARKSLKQAMP